MSSSEDEVGVIRGGASARRQRLFSDDEDDSRSVGGRSDQDQDDNDQGQTTRDKDTDEEEEAEENRKEAERKKKKEEAKKKPKGPVRRQMISEDMLTGKNGISKLPELFEDFKFGGKGREKEDLNGILAKLEHWIHLLHPKQPFDQCLQRIEFLGMKRKIVKVHLKKIRMNMLSNFEADDNLVLNDDDDDDIDALEAASRMEEGRKSQNQPGSSVQLSGNLNANCEDELPDDDELMDLMQQPVKKVIPSGNQHEDEFPDDDELEELMNQPAKVISGPSTVQPNSSNVNTNDIGFDDDDDGFPDDDELDEIMNRSVANCNNNTISISEQPTVLVTSASKSGGDVNMPGDGQEMMEVEDTLPEQTKPNEEISNSNDAIDAPSPKECEDAEARASSNQPEPVTLSENVKDVEDEDDGLTLDDLRDDSD